MPQTWRRVTDHFPSCGWLCLPLPPLQSVASIKYYDTDGVQQTLDAAVYQVSTAGDQAGRIVFDRDQSTLAPTPAREDT